MRAYSFRMIAIAQAAAATIAVAQVNDPAQAPVQALNDGLLGLMKAGKPTGIKGRVAAIAPVVDRVYDLPLMTRLAVGSAWTTIGAADQTALIAAFRRMTISQYASNFDGFSGQSFTIAPKVDVRGTDRLVRTTLNSRGAAPIAIAYRLRSNNGSWRIIDVFYRDSISQLATRRADFSAILASGGAKALVAHMNALSTKAGG